ncbi:MAG: DUF4251 domain-containing protein [Chitinophagaceae bacterium]|nr:DUF4251 domain-containing protein [Chitinophagaceae bacterium]
MKTFPYKFTKIFLFFFSLLAFTNLTMAQDEKTDKSDKEASVKPMIDAQRYVFKAQSVHPSRGRVVQLTSEYDLSVSGDTVRSYLPYFGRAYSAPLDGRGGGIDFLSRDFEYNQKERKKGGWDISIKPRDINDVRELFLTVFDNGTASLRVSSSNREPISFNGYLVGK